VANSPRGSSRGNEHWSRARNGGVTTSTFSSGARSLRWTADVNEQQNRVVVTSPSSTLGRRNSGRAVKVQRRQGAKVKVWSSGTQN
jgi:hypothetical protein